MEIERIPLTCGLKIEKMIRRKKQERLKKQQRAELVVQDFSKWHFVRIGKSDITNDVEDSVDGYIDSNDK